MKPKLKEKFEAFGFDDGLLRFIAIIPEDQPRENLGIFEVFDQFGEHHFVMKNGINCEGLNPFYINNSW